MSARLLNTALAFSLCFAVLNLNAQEKEDAGDLEKICQLTIDIEKLDAYYKIDKHPDRSPLRIVKNEIIKEDLPLVKFGSKVRFLSISQEQKKSYTKPFFEFTTIEIKGDDARVEFQYPPEEIRGNVSLRKDDGEWKVRFSSIVNYPKVITIQKKQSEKKVPAPVDRKTESQAGIKDENADIGDDESGLGEEQKIEEVDPF